MARLSLGIDCGSTTTKGALFDGETVVKTILLPTAARPRERMGQIYDALYSPEVEYVVTTGYGRELLPQAHKRVTEITCHAKGAAYLCLAFPVWWTSAARTAKQFCWIGTAMWPISS